MGIANLIFSNSLDVVVFGEKTELLSMAFLESTDFFLKENIKFVSTPRHADVLLINGAISNKTAKILRGYYDDMLSPKWVISINPKGTYDFYSSYSIINDITKVVPVNIFTTLTHETKENLIKSFLRLKEMIKTNE